MQKPIQKRLRKIVREAHQSPAFWKERVRLLNAALAQSRENYKSVLEDYHRMERRNSQQEATIYRIRACVKALADRI